MLQTSLVVLNKLSSILHVDHLTRKFEIRFHFLLTLDSSFERYTTSAQDRHHLYNNQLWQFSLCVYICLKSNFKILNIKLCAETEYIQKISSHLLCIPPRFFLSSSRITYCIYIHFSRCVYPRPDIHKSYIYGNEMFAQTLFFPTFLLIQNLNIFQLIYYVIIPRNEKQKSKNKEKKIS